MNRIVSILFVCLMQASLAVASTYNLRVEVTPDGAGTLNTSSGVYEEGASVYLRTYKNTGFVFKGWFEGDSLLSSATSFYYTMPARDAAVQARYEYDPTVPDNPAMPDTATYYLFTASVSPDGAGTLNISSGKYAQGADVYVRTYANTGFQFVGWEDENGEILSTNTSYHYSMPGKNAHLTAVYNYDPTVPANPDSMGVQRRVSVVCKPVGGGSFNVNNTIGTAGSNVRLYAYTNTGFKFLYWENEEGDTLSSEQNFYYVIPDKDSKVYGVFEYDPAVPGNPNNNYWNKELGEIIVDDFAPGGLSSAVSSAISGSSRNDVAMIIVAGRMNDNDFGIANNYENCTLLDLSRVTGVSEIPSYAFDYTNLETVYLPATIEVIGYRAFADCQNLSSLTCYAMTPPVLEDYVFKNVPEGLVVYVPAAAIAQYQDAEGWKNFTILPIQEDIRGISISLPEGTNAADYAQMWLELTNTKSGQRMHYVMTDRTQYTFANIIRNTSWNVTLRNERGDIFGQIDNVEVKDEDVSVTFSSLSKPQSVVLSVLTSDGQDVTTQTQVTWTDAQGNYVAQGVSLTGLPTGYQTTYRIVLSQELAMAYNTPQPVDYVLTDGDNRITCQLNAIPQVKISGKVKDASTGLALSGAVISASQTFGGKYSKTLNTKTDGNGLFTLDIANVPTSIAFAASDYVSQAINCDSLLTGVGGVTLPEVLLKTITGATITLGFTYTPCEGDTQNWYSDYQNVSYELFNVTKNKAVSQYNVQYPQIVLLEEIADGDVLRLTATSRTNAFMPVTATATIAEQMAEATFAITELGCIEASFSKTGNASVVGSLYDASGKLVKTYNYSNASLTINDLADGNYTLVSMGNSRLFNTIYDLSQLPQTGLVEGTDYVLNAVEVKSGAVSQISIDEVPTLDESKLYYTGDNTSFTVNKPSIVAGNYLTLTGRIDFKPAYATNVSNVQMVVDLPESCEFVENSVMVGNSTSSYTINGNQITIPMARYTDRVRFCIIPTLGGEYAPSAFAQFDLNGETVTQPIGSANYTAKDLSISVPSTVAKTNIPVSGTAIGTSSVEIYDNDVLIGQTTSMANGTWATTCELHEPYNLSRHQIYAKVTTKQGIELTSENVSCVYDMNAIQVSVVKMYHDNPELHKTYELTFDFLNPSNKEENYIYYIYNKKFTFTIDFTNNDTTKVSNVILYVKTAKSGWHPLEAIYDTKQDKWVAAGEFGNMYDGDLPVNVSVDFDLLSYGPVSRQALTEAKFDYYNYKQEVESIGNEVDNLIASASNLSTEEFEEAFTSLFGSSVSSSPSTTNGRSLDDLLSYADLLITQSNELISEDNLNNGWKQFLHQTEYGTIDLSTFGIDGSLLTEEVGNITPEELVELGFKKIEMDDYTDVYELVTDNKYVVVDFNTNTYKTLSYKYKDNLSRVRRASNSNSNDIQILIDQIVLFEGKVSDFVNLVGNINTVISKVPDFFKNKIWGIDAQIATNRDTYQALRQSITTDMPEDQVAKITEKVEKLIQENCRLGQEKRLLNTTLKNLEPAISKITLGVSALCNAYTMGNNLREYIDLWFDVPYCGCNPERTTSLQKAILNAGLRCAAKDLANIVGDMILLHTVINSAAAAPVTGGQSLIVTAGSIALAVGKWKVNDWSNKEFAKERARFRSQAIALGRDESCRNCPDPEPEPTKPPKPTNPTPPKPKNDNGGDHKSNNNDKKFGIDPSGYVYEGIMTNRVEGVTATIYYKEDIEDMYGDLHENIVKWNAEEYAQENPLFTDENGFYRWDVPQGLWQVKFEKEGYETTYSEWLPVPPPQLDINIAMKQNRQPEVKAARAYEDAVEVEFDKYMMPELLTTENIIVMQNGIAVEGTVELLNEEVSYEGEAETFASKIRFNAAQPFTEQEITLMVNNRVRSYAGIRMQDNYQQTFTIEQEIKQIVSDSVVTVGYGNISTLTVSVLPASASKGKTLTVKTSSPMILGIETEQVTIGNDGKAEITVSGQLPGTAALTFSVEGTDKTAMTIANVEQILIKTVVTPKASIASGSNVEKGTAITLTCETEGSTIYYTLDGTCPCENTSSVIRYDGTPIVINETTTIKAIAYAEGMYESEVATFVYTVNNGSGIDEEKTGKYTVYPQLVKDIVNIDIQDDVSANVCIASVHGQTVYERKNMTGHNTVDMTDLTKGMYVVAIRNGNELVSIKIIKIGN